MRNGTQEELDAAREDATKLPFDVIFQSGSGKVFRQKNKDFDQDDAGSVRFHLVEYDYGVYFDVDDLQVAE